MVKFSILLLVLLVCCSVHISQQQTLRSLAEAQKRYVGVALGAQQLADQEYAKVLDREIDMITPENAMKWKNLERSRGYYMYHEADTIVEHARAHNQRMRGHTLVWHEEVPDWVEQGHFNATQLWAILKEHITNEVTRYKGKIYAWDVVNEVISDEETMRDTIWYKALGKKFIVDAFKLAHEIDPAAKLYINDYDMEAINKKSDLYYELVKELKAANVPVHGVGFQAHLNVGGVPKDLVKNLERFAALGVDVAITELDVQITMPTTAENLAQQGKDFQAVTEACIAVPRCVGVTTWGLTDKYSWIPQFTQHKQGAGLPFDEHFKEKAAYNGMKLALSKH